MAKYAVGVDFGTESGRAALVNVRMGRRWQRRSIPIRTA